MPSVGCWFAPHRLYRLKHLNYWRSFFREFLLVLYSPQNHSFSARLAIPCPCNIVLLGTQKHLEFCVKEIDRIDKLLFASVFQPGLSYYNNHSPSYHASLHTLISDPNSSRHSNTALFQFHLLTFNDIHHHFNRLLLSFFI